MDATQELQLVNAVDLRITMAGEEKLGDTINVYLVPLLTKLASPHQDVRHKVVEMCQHINTRIKNTTFVLPVEALVKQFVDSNSELVRNFDLMYIEMGINRVGEDTKRALIPSLIKNISGHNYNHAKAVFGILLKLLPFMSYPDRGSLEADGLRQKLEFADADMLYLATRFTDVFNFSPSKRTGMTIREYEFLSEDQCSTATKTHMLKFIAALFTDEESYVPLLCAATDGNSGVAEPANDAWRKLQVNLEGEELINKLYGLLLGQNGASPVKQTTQAKILGALCHSVLAANQDNAFAAIQYFTQTDFYSRAAVIQFVNWIVKHANEQLFLRHSGDLLERVTHLGNDAKTAESAQELMGGILRRDSRLLSNVSHVTFLFDRKAGDSLSELINPLAEQPDTAQKLLPHLKRYMNQPATQFMAAKYATRVYPYSSAEARLLCLVGLTLGRTELTEECTRGMHPYWMRAVNVPYISSNDSLAVIKGEGGGKHTEFPDLLELCKLISESTFDLRKSAEWLFPYLVRLTVATAIAGQDTVCVIDEQWETRIDEALKSDDTVRRLVIDYLSNTDISAVLQIISSSGTFAVLTEVALELYHSLVSLSTKTYSVSDKSVVSLALTSPYYKVQASAAKVIGLETVSPDLIDQCFSHVAKNVDGPVLVFANLVDQLAHDDISKVLELCSTHIDLESVQAFLSELKLHRVAAVDSWERLADVKKKTLTKPTEQSVLAFAYLNLEAADFVANVDKIFAIESKKMDFAFFTGEALCILAGGWENKFVERRMWRVISKYQTDESKKLASERLSELTTRLIDMAKTVTKPSLRKSVAIWLLSIVQYCGHIDSVQLLLPQLQLAFMRFLPEKDDIVQEAASRGLSLVYEQGDSRLQKDLVENLVSSFVTDKSSHQKVHQETELFEPGVLNTGDGSISTYKDILSLASEVGDPSLVYRFMSLANHASLWSSRKGIAFGLGSIFAKSSLEQQLADNPALGKTLIPKLYRYKFDPSTGQVMANIWKMLIGDSAKTVTAHFESILKELLSSTTAKEWRVRQASATALLDLLQGRPISQYLTHLSDIWTACFRVVDDIKESVRTAGLALTRGLTTSLVRSLESDSISDATAQEVLEQIIPFLLGNSGLQSSAEEVQHFSLDVLLKLIKKGGSRLKPFIPDLLGEFVELLSTLEPQAMNYIALNADKYGTTANDIDSSRLAAVRHSPMMDSIEEIIDLLDADLMKKIIPKLSTSIRKSVGLPSKVAGSRIIVTMTIRKTQLFKPYAGQLLTKSAIPCIYDRNETVSRSYLAACGYLCRLADEDSVLGYVTELQKLYFGEIQKGNLERARISAAVGVKEISAHAADKFDSLSAALLPLIFVGKHDSDSAVGDVFTNIWNNNTGGKGAISLHIKEIISLVSPHLSSQQWNIKQIAATSIADACNSVGKTSLNPDELFQVMIAACQGKSWTGKEAVFDALVSLAIKFNRKEGVDKVVVTEMKRKNREYQILALKSASRYLSHFPQEELFDTFSEICSLYLLSKSDMEDVDMDSDDEEDSKAQSEDRRNAILGTAIRAVAIEDTTEDVSFLSGYFSQVAEWIELALVPPKNLNKVATKKSVDPTWKSKLCINQALYAVVVGFFGQAKNAEFEKQFMGVWTLVSDTCLLSTNLDKTKVEVCKLGQAVFNSKMSQQSKDKVRETLTLAEENEQSLIVKAELGRVLKKD